MDSIEGALTKWNEGTLAELGKTPLLSVEDLDTVKKCAAAIHHAFTKTQYFRTPTEMRISVLNDVKFPTPDAKFWQAVREMNVMVENLINLSFAFRRKEIDLREKQGQLDALNLREEQLDAHIEDGFARERLTVDIEQIKWELLCTQREAHHRIREIDQWRKIEEDLTKVLSSGVEDVNLHQLLSYTIRFLQEYKIAVESGADKAGGVGAIRNLNAHVVTSLNVIESSNLMFSLVKILRDYDPKLLDFLIRRQIIKKEYTREQKTGKGAERQQ